MKRLNIIKIIIMILSISVLMVPALSFAQPEDYPPPPGFHMPPHDGPMPLKIFLSELKDRLNLTDDQTAKIQKIFDAQHQEMEKMIDSLENQRQEMFKKIEQQRKQTDEKISALLSDEQKKKFEEMQKHHRHIPRPMERPMHEECPDR